jgi:uncharacterized Rmd1/YagE family protein
MSRKGKKSKKSASQQGVRSPTNMGAANQDEGGSNNEEVLQSCTTISTCEEYDLAKVVSQFYNQGLRSARVLLPGEMVHVNYPYSAGKVADVLVLSNGTIVAWGMAENEVADQLIPLLRRSELRSYKDSESEDMDFVEEESASRNDEGNEQQNNDTQTSTMVGEVIYIRGSSPTERLLKKAAFSSGLARNTKLAALEFSMEKFILSIKQISQTMASGGHLGLKGNQVLRITGQLLQIRGQLNLYSELIETPDHYWSEPELEALYTLISKKLDVVPRIAILNKKLDYASELVGILKTHVSEQQSTRLEWMIIILIMVEVCFEIFHFIERYYPSESEKSEN